MVLMKSVVMGQGPMELISSFESKVACCCFGEGGEVTVSGFDFDFDFDFLVPGPWFGAVVLVDDGEE